MHWFVALVLLVLIAPAPAAGQEPQTEDEKAIYVLGLALSERLAAFALTPAELELVKAGLTDGALGREPKVDPRAYTARIQQLRQARASVVAEAEKKSGQAYLAKAAAEPGATKTASGLVMTTLKPGTGATPKATDKVKVHYHGTLPDGSVFDSSAQRGQPATFPLNGVIKCWTEGLQLMKVGGKSRLVCPSEIAYGDRGAPPRIKPGATLIFEVELLEIVGE
jgi:FKBP-type peptidyl-prolyl cis-trans isomerase FkpA/FKBP-type peptidyl-prolyl cis-trans isomerase FklB